MLVSENVCIIVCNFGSNYPNGFGKWVLNLFGNLQKYGWIKVLIMMHSCCCHKFFTIKIITEIKN